MKKGKKMYKKIGGQIKVIIAVSALMLNIFNSAYAKPSTKEIIAQIGRVNNANKITYAYKVQLFSAIQSKCIDSIQGRLFKDGKNYFDSSNNSMTMVSGKYCLSIKLQDKTATVYDLNYLHKKIGFQQTNISQAFIIPDSAIIKNGKLRETTEAYIIEVFPPSRLFSKVIIKVNKNNFQLISIAFETQEFKGNKHLSTRRYTIENVQSSFNSSIIDITRFISINNKTVILNKKYADFKIKTITG